MKLDRNINQDQTGKYALVKQRRLKSLSGAHRRLAEAAYEVLKSLDCICEGSESPGDQFFVMKYKDRFTAPGLRGYAAAITSHLSELPLAKTKDRKSLAEYHNEIIHEAAEAHRVGRRIPD